MSEFDLRPLGELADCRMGETILSKDLDGTGYPIFSADSSAGAWGHKKQISKILKRGSIVIGARGTIGNPRLPDEDEFGCTQTTIAVTPCSEVDPYYLKLALELSDIKSIAAQQAVPMLTIGQISQLEIAVPSLPEQKKIAEILSGIDNVISRKSIRNEKQTTTTNLILESVFSNSEYRQLPLSEIALLERGKFSHRPRNDPAFYGGKHPFIQTGDIPKSGIRICEHKQTLNEKGLRVSRQFPKGTLVITIAATIGEVGILSYPACFPDSLVGITPNTEECDPVYLHFSLRRLKEKLLQMAPQSAQSNLNLEILGKLLVPLPPLNEQRRLARMICCEDSRASTESTGINKLQHMKNAVASDLLSGRKRVSV